MSDPKPAPGPAAFTSIRHELNSRKAGALARTRQLITALEHDGHLHPTIDAAITEQLQVALYDLHKWLMVIPARHTDVRTSWSPMQLNVACLAIRDASAITNPTSSPASTPETAPAAAEPTAEETPAAPESPRTDSGAAPERTAA